DRVGVLPGSEDVHLDLLSAVVGGAVGPELDQVQGGFGVGRLVVAGERLVRPSPPGLAVGELHGLVAVALIGLDLGHRARAGLDDRDRHRARVVGEDLRHPELGPEDALRRSHVVRPYSLISMSTPAERLRRWSSCTVLAVASMMSISRLWVSIWKCSRLSLSLWGDRITVYSERSVGRGTGPTTRAPVRVT